MNLGTAITLLIVGGLLFLALRSIVRDFRNGTSKCAECGGSCGKTAQESCPACEIADNMVERFNKAEGLGIDEYHAQVLPEDKSRPAAAVVSRTKRVSQAHKQEC